MAERATQNSWTHMIEAATAIPLGFWMESALALGAVALMGIAAMLSARPRLRRLRTQHLQTHPSLSDEEFIQQVEVPAERGEIALDVRQGVASAMGVPPETVHPSDSLAYICQFGFDGIDFLAIVSSIEDALCVSLPSNFWKPLFPVKRAARDVSLGELARFVVHNWESLAALKPPKTGSKGR